MRFDVDQSRQLFVRYPGPPTAPSDAPETCWSAVVKAARVSKKELLRHRLHPGEAELLRELRGLRRRRREIGPEAAAIPLTVGQKIADQVAATMGSWRFIIIQSSVLVAWITLNVVAVMHRWDPYPFILLNLALSFQAAYAAPFIMMSQNRQQQIDRKEAADDYRINIKAELEIELLHEKIDRLREKEVVALTEAVEALAQTLRDREQR
jgi:uncharacterized membrane protein